MPLVVPVETSCKRLARGGAARRSSMRGAAWRVLLKECTCTDCCNSPTATGQPSKMSASGCIDLRRFCRPSLQVCRDLAFFFWRLNLSWPFRKISVEFSTKRKIAVQFCKISDESTAIWRFFRLRFGVRFV
eukprot:scaffold30067_cov141-Isochrysis_galbana.AAC.1